MNAESQRRGRVRVTQVRSRIDSKPKAKRTLDALGLRRNYRSVVHVDTPQLQGMLRQIAHLVRVKREKDAS